MVNNVSLDELLPRWHFRERHRCSNNVPAPAVLAAVEQLTWAEVPVLRVLMRIRAAGRLSPGRRRPILDDMLALGFVVLDRSGDELVLGALGRPWGRRGGRAPRLAEQSDPARLFVEFSQPSWAKMIANFRVSRGELTTETRVLLTDERSRHAFGRYWLVIRPFSGLIRRRWLAAIVRRASPQRASTAGTPSGEVWVCQTMSRTKPAITTPWRCRIPRVTSSISTEPVRAAGCMARSPEPRPHRRPR